MPVLLSSPADVSEESLEALDRAAAEHEVQRQRRRQQEEATETLAEKQIAADI